MGALNGEIIGIYRNQIAAFVRAIRDGLPSPIPLTEGVAGVRVAEAILQSVQSGLPVEL
jgi:predicted dehydrogenase